MIVDVEGGEGSGPGRDGGCDDEQAGVLLDAARDVVQWLHLWGGLQR